MNLNAEREVFKSIDRMRDEILDFARELVRIPSVVGSEGEAQGFIKRKFEQMRLETRVIHADKSILQNHPGYCDVSWEYEDRPNIIGILRGKRSHKSLILNGHIDVVSTGPLNLWTHDPWGAEVDGGKLYGRGAWDMKAGVAAMVFAVQSLQNVGIELNGDIILESVIEEEAGGGGGVLTTLLQGFRADGAIIPEPSSLNVWLASNGVSYFRVRVEGKTAHPLHSKSGVDAVEEAFLVWHALKDLSKLRRTEVQYPLFDGEADYACDLNVGMVRAGDWPSTVPGWAEMDCRISYVPGENREEIKALVEETIYQASRRDTWLKDHPPQIQWFGWNAEPSEQSKDHPLITTLMRIAREECGFTPRFTGFAGGLDTRLFIKYGDMPSFCFGPRGNGIHGVDEFVVIEDIYLVAKVLARTIEEWLNH
jgi:acetylornithine deacetylase